MSRNITDIKDGFSTEAVYEILRSEGIVDNKVLFSLIVLGASESYASMNPNTMGGIQALSAIYFLRFIPKEQFRNPENKQKLLMLFALHLSKQCHYRIEHGKELAVLFTKKQIDIKLERKNLLQNAKELDEDLQMLLDESYEMGLIENE